MSFFEACYRTIFMIRLSFCIVLSCAIHTSGYGQWIVSHVGSVGVLHDVVYTNSNVYWAIGEPGVFKGSLNLQTQTWDRLVPSDPMDSVVYEDSHFFGITEFGNSLILVGQEIGQSRAVIFRLDQFSGQFDLIYTGTPGTKLNSVSEVDLGELLAVGDGGLLLHLTLQNSNWQNWILQPQFTFQDLNEIRYSSGEVLLGGDSCLYRSTSILNQRSVEYVGNVIDLQIGQSQEIAVIDGEVYLHGNLGWSRLALYDAPLNAKCAYTQGQVSQFVGTASGMRISWGSPNVLNRVPSAGQRVINAIKQGIGSHTVAVSDSGNVLLSTSGFFNVMPYMNISANSGGCVGNSVQIHNNGSNGFDWEWFVNGSYVSDNYNYNLNLPTIGTYDVTLVSTDGPYSDTIQITVTAVQEPPVTQLSYSLSDSLFCKSADPTVSVFNTDASYSYRLYRLEDMSLQDEVLGNGGTVLLQAQALPDSCTLGIAVKWANIDCEKLVGDPMAIHVEKTKATFEKAYLNVYQNEPCQFWNTSDQTVSVEWQFSNGATPVSSTSFDPLVSYSGLGAGTARLIATSAHGCKDTLFSQEPFVHGPQPLQADSCWAFRINTPDSVRFGNERLTSLAITDDNIVYVSGRIENTQINSIAGAPSLADSLFGQHSFFAQYDENGLLKWLVKGNGAWSPTNFLNLNYPLVRAVTGTNDVLISWNQFLQSGILVGTQEMELNDGSIYKHQSIAHKHHVAVLDSLGRLRWAADLADQVIDMAVADNGEIHLLMKNCGYISPSGDTTSCAANTRNFTLLKLDANGERIWDLGMLMVNPINQASLYSIAIDSSGGIFVGGAHDQRLIIESLNGQADSITCVPCIHEGVVLKFSSSGNLLWLNRLREGIIRDLVTDDQGNVYGAFEQRDLQTTLLMQNGPAVLVDQTNVPIISYAPNGALRWFSGSNTSYMKSQLDFHPMLGVTLSGFFGLGGSNSPPFAVQDPLGNTLDSVYASSRTMPIARWDVNGNLKQLTTYEGDSVSTFIPSIRPIDIQSSVDGNLFFTNTISSGSVHNDTTIMAGDTIIMLAGKNAGVLGKLDDELCSSITQIVTSNSTPKVNDENQMLIYPNPLNDGSFAVRIPSKRPGKLTILDGLGSLVETRLIQSDRKLNISLDPGIYLLVLDVEGELHSGRLVVID